MPKRKAKKGTKQSASSQLNKSVHAEENALIDQEVIHGSETCSNQARTISDVETERVLTAIGLLESNTSKEQLQIPLLKFFEETLPNLTVSRTEKNEPIDIKWKDKDGDLYMNTADGGNMISYFLQHMSAAKSDFDFSSKAGKSSFIGADDLQIQDFVLQEPSCTHALGIRDFMQTPGANSGRMSNGMTPKTLRLPKQGEMLMSVHGSPVGVTRKTTWMQYTRQRKNELLPANFLIP